MDFLILFCLFHFFETELGIRLYVHAKRLTVGPNDVPLDIGTADDAPYRQWGTVHSTIKGPTYLIPKIYQPLALPVKPRCNTV